MRDFAIFNRAGLYLAAVLMATVPAPSSAQGTVAAVTPADTEAAPGGDIPEAVIASALSGSRAALLILNRYLTAGAAPAEMARRATRLIQALGALGQSVDADQLLRALDRVTGLAGRSLASAQILQLGVDFGFRPTEATLAWDFGPPDGPVAPGFERIVPGDPRITGARLASLRRPDDNSLLSDGVRGVSRIETAIPNGDYRVILMTQNLSDPRLSGNPFGRRIRVNGVPVLVPRPRARDWTSQAMLSSRGMALVGDGGQTGGGLHIFSHPSASTPLLMP